MTFAVKSLSQIRAAACRPIRQRTVRLRLTLLYGALFVLSGSCLLAITWLLILRYSPSHFLADQTQSGGQLFGTQPAHAPRNVPLVEWTGLGSLVTSSAIALSIMAVLSVIAGWFVAGRILRPLRTMTVTTRRISEDNLHQRLALPGPQDELKDLGDTIDGLLARLERAIAAQRQFTANASHELRTPLTLEQTLLESALTHPRPTAASWRSTCERVLASSQRQARLIDALLVLARSQQDLYQRESFDLSNIAATALRTLDRDASARNVSIEALLQPGFISGDIRLIERLVANLLQNAVRHNVRGGQVFLSTSTRAAHATLQITNTGPTVPAGQIPQLFQPFQRRGTQRIGEHDGLGLGLSIVAAVAAAHDAALAAQPGPDGGLDIEVIFPPPHTIIPPAGSMQHDGANAP